jgi:hypothetical protein
MATQFEFDFPDPDKDGAVVSDKGVEVTLDAEKPAGDRVKTIKKGEVEIDIVDDRPPEDRGVPRAKKPDPVTDDELSKYDEGVKARLQQLQRGYDDERRAKETARRQREELERVSKTLIEENQRLKADNTNNYNAMIVSAQQQVNLELEAAKKQYKTAYDSGDSDALLAAQEALTTAKIRADKVAGLKPRALQQEEKQVQQPKVEADSQPQQVARDEKAEAWRGKNQWFGTDDEMTAAALGYHTKLVKEGVDPRSDAYYDRINARMREMFPSQFDKVDTKEEEVVPQQARKAQVVAPATRSVAPKKVTLTHTQVQLAKRLGVSLTDYAQHLLKLSGK